MAAALRILIAEVRMALELPVDSSMMQSLAHAIQISAQTNQSPAQTSRVLIEMFLQAVLEGASGPPEGVISLPGGASGSPGGASGLPGAASSLPQSASSPSQGLSVLPQGVSSLPGAASVPPGGVSGLPAWVAASTRIELAFVSAIDRAVDAVAAWREVPHVVVDAAKETRALVVLQLSDEPFNPLWLRPEWLGLAPKIERYWRRRRLTRRGMTDPDFRPFRDADEREPDLEDKPPSGG
jgi:hypothetical protein